MTKIRWFNKDGAECTTPSDGCFGIDCDALKAKYHPSFPDVTWTIAHSGGKDFLCWHGYGKDMIGFAVKNDMMIPYQDYKEYLTYILPVVAIAGVYYYTRNS
jgi:hypothetical protein